jgi:outer membrane cobalamin receptor
MLLVLVRDGRAQKNDSLRTYHSAPIIVTAADSIGIVQGRFGKSITTAQLSRLTADPILSQSLPLLSSTIDVRSYSSLGGVAFLSIHGMPPEYTIVYRDGIRTTNDQNSLSDLGRASNYALERISILSAPAATILGGDAIGAAIVLESRHAEVTRFELGTSALAYQTSRQPSEIDADVKADLRLDSSYAIAITASNQHSDGAFPFLQSTGQIQKRENNDATVRDYSLTADYLPSPSASTIANSTRLSLLLDYTLAERGAPGAATVDYRGASSFDARQADEDLFAALKFSEPFEDGIGLDASVAYQSQFETYNDPHILPQGLPIADHYLNRIESATLHYWEAFSPTVTVHLGGDASENALFSNENYTAANDSLISRDHASLFGALDLHPVDALDAVLSLRGEWNGLLATKALPQISITYHPLEWLESGAAYSIGYHAPTLNELYWKVGGNRDLHEERAQSSEAYVKITTHPLEGVSVSVGASYFYSDFEDQILWEPRADGIFAPINILNSRNQGSELTGRLRVAVTKDLALDVSESYTLLSAKNKTPDPTVFDREIPFSSPTSSVFTALLTHSSIGALAFTAHYRGHRYTDLGNTTSGKLQPFQTLDVVASSNPLLILDQVFITLQLAVRNLGDAQYVEQPYYPLPGRNVRLSINLNPQLHPQP